MFFWCVENEFMLIIRVDKKCGFKKLNLILKTEKKR